MNRQRGLKASITEAEFKQDRRSLSKVWHPDTAAGHGFYGDVGGVMGVINKLYDGIDREHIATYQEWPSDFQDGEEVSFPSTIEGEDPKKLFLPRTPQEFLDLLAYLKHNKSFPLKDYPKTRLARSKGNNPFAENSAGTGKGFMDAEFSDEFGKYRASLLNNKDIDDLQRKLIALEVLPPGYAETYELHTIIDGQAEYLLNSAFIRACTEQEADKASKEFAQVFEKIRGFPFSNTSIAQRLESFGAQQLKTYFIEKAKRAQSLEGLKTLSAIVSALYANLPDLATDGAAITDFIAKKHTSYTGIWGLRDTKGSA